MTCLGFGRYTLGLIVAVALLAACGGTQPPMGAANALGAHGEKQSQTFSYTGAEQTFTVPSGVTAVTVTASGASGSSTFGRSGPSGLGGLVKATIPVTPGEALAVFVGGAGSPEGTGYNGGAAPYTGGSCNPGCGGGGGGASDVRQGGDHLRERLVVAGGGGGQDSSGGAQGGAGGGLRGAEGANGANRGQGHGRITGGK
ncbi:MAG: glycine-rich protein, partial [Candidatus Cybelea sp.]